MQSNLDSFFSTKAVTSCGDEAVVHSKEDFARMLQKNESEAAGGEKSSVLGRYFLSLCCNLPINLRCVFPRSFPLPKTV